MAPARATVTLFRVLEVTSYGGFFGGVAATVVAAPLAEGAERTLTIAPDALRNVAGDHHLIVPGLALDVEFEGENVGSARVAGAPERTLLRETVIPDTSPADAPRVFSHRCEQCGLWILGAPRDGACALQGHVL